MRKHADAWEVNQIPISQVADDWGIEMQPVSRTTNLIMCPNPKHDDPSMGSCKLTEDGDRNVFHCFSCGAGGGPIDLVMYKDNCDFKTALETLAKKYGLERDVDPASLELPKRWEGLTPEEYKVFGLIDASIPVVDGYNAEGEPIYHYKRYSLKDLARTEPELHDDMLINKFWEVGVAGTLLFMQKLDEGEFFFVADGMVLSRQWEEACALAIKDMLALVKKGLMDKSRYGEIAVLDAAEMSSRNDIAQPA